ncbi:MAG TPA: hypothetical protein VFE96_05345, partial [Candidatus Bathyarchaeia archaeon]|nr:hypothetical protein [Candidatus Bathyarchaeia archaeon]
MIYLVDLLPVIGFGLLLAMLAIMVWNWRSISDAIGFGIARKRRTQKKKSRAVQIIVWMAAWATAIVALYGRCGDIFCKAPAKSATLSQPVTNAVSGTGQPSSIPLLSVVIQLNSFVQSNWFYFAFL